MIFLHHADPKNADGNSHLATTSHKLHNTDTTKRTVKFGFLRTYAQSGLTEDNMQATRRRSCYYVLRLSVSIN